MKKRFLILLGLCFISFSIFSFEGIDKKSTTKDGYDFRLYQIDKSEYSNCFEFYIILTSDNTQKHFVWCYDSLIKATTHFKWLETIDVEYYDLINSDVRITWRGQSYRSEKKIHTYSIL